MDRQCYVTEKRGSETSTRTGRKGGRISPGLGISEERLVERVGREVMVLLDYDGLVGLGDGLSVDCGFDHFQVSL